MSQLPRVSKLADAVVPSHKQVNLRSKALTVAAGNTVYGYSDQSLTLSKTDMAGARQVSFGKEAMQTRTWHMLGERWGNLRP
jgi:hypothetical protein